MATKLFLRNTTANAIGNYYDMITSAGAFTDSATVNTSASGTEIQWTRTAGGTVLEFISGRAPSGGFTLAGTMTFDIFALESNMSANAGGRARVFKRTALGVETEVLGGPWSDGVEFGTTIAEMTWTGTPTSTVFLEDDRIIVRYYITNVGTMAGSFTCRLDYNDVANGSYFQINETVTFKAETSDVTVALSGASATAAQGTLPPATDKAVSGQSATAAQGTTTPGISIALTGQSLSVARGTVTAVGGDVTAALTGLSLSAGVGTLAPATDNAVTGQSLGAAQGTAVPQLALPISGQAITAAQGTISPATDKALTGQAGAVAGGTLLPATALPLTGNALAGAQGSISGATSLALTGQALTAARGTVLGATSIGITGQSGAVNQGFVSAGSDVIVALTGQALAVARGSLAPETSLAVSGQSVSTAMGSLIPELSASISGHALAIAQGSVSVLAASDVTVALTGHSLSVGLGMLTGKTYILRPIRRSASNDIDRSSQSGPITRGASSPRSNRTARRR